MAVGWYPIVMVSIEFEARTITHWVVVTGPTRLRIFNDRLKDPAEEHTATRIDDSSFAKMTEFGPTREKAVSLAAPRNGMSRFRFPEFIVSINLGLTCRALLVPNPLICSVAAKSPTYSHDESVSNCAPWRRQAAA
ncbi:hypothetical protein [Bradyrhizobium sp. USDA 4486]